MIFFFFLILGGLHVFFLWWNLPFPSFPLSCLSSSTHQHLSVLHPTHPRFLALHHNLPALTKKLNPNINWRKKERKTFWESPSWPERTEPRSLWFGQCYSCLSTLPQALSCFEGESTQTQTGTGLHINTIFGSFLSSTGSNAHRHTLTQFDYSKPQAGLLVE